MKPIIATQKRGVFLLDVCVGIVLISVVAVILMQAVFQIGQHRLDRRMRLIAEDTLLNVVEILDGDSDIQSFQKQVEPFRETAARSLPDGKLEVRVLPDPPGENLQLLEIAVSYDRGKSLPRREFSVVRLFSVSK